MNVRDHLDLKFTPLLPSNGEKLMSEVVTFIKILLRKRKEYQK